jgi:FkbM family methyltransferase
MPPAPEKARPGRARAKAAGGRVRRQEAIHPHWNSVLEFTTPGAKVLHTDHGSRGKFRRDGNHVTIEWDGYPADHFTDVDGLLVHRDIMQAVPDINRSRVGAIGTHSVRVTRVHVRVPAQDYEVELRLFTSDIPIFHQVFAALDYESPNLPKSARTIVDLGANIGLASVFFALRYPQARILAVEPDAENFALLVRNTAPLWPRVTAREGAVWTHDGSIDLRHEDNHGRPLGAWGVQVAPQSSPTGTANTATSCFSMITLMAQAGFDEIDILKCDIEGAETELFTTGAEAWLPKVRLLIIETHDWFRPGSDAAVRAAVAPWFKELPRSGENLFFRRRAPRQA